MIMAINIFAGIGIMVFIIGLYVLVHLIDWKMFRFIDPRYWRCRIFHKLEKKMESRQMLFGGYSHSYRIKCTVCNEDYGRA